MDTRHTYGSLSVNAESAAPRFHCEHQDHTISLALTPEMTLHHVYVCGEPSDIRAMAYDIIAALDTYKRERRATNNNLPATRIITRELCATCGSFLPRFNDDWTCCAAPVLDETRNHFVEMRAGEIIQQWEGALTDAPQPLQNEESK